MSWIGSILSLTDSLRFGHEKVGPEPPGLPLTPPSSLADRNTEMRLHGAPPFAHGTTTLDWTLVRDGGVRAGVELVPVASGYGEELNSSRTSLIHWKIWRGSRRTDSGKRGVGERDLAVFGGRYTRATKSGVGRPVALVQQITTLNPFRSSLSSRTVRCG